MGKQDKGRRVHPKESKAEAAAHKRGKPADRIAADVGVNESVSRRWTRQARETAGNGLAPVPGPRRPQDEELARLRKEAKALRKVNEILKKSSGHLRTGGTPVMVYRFMRENRDQYTIRGMAGLFGISSSAYYRWAKYGVSGRDSADAELVGLIREIALKYHWQYGSPRVRETLPRDYGKRVSRKKVARLMRENGLNARRGGNTSPRTDGV